MKTDYKPKLQTLKDYRDAIATAQERMEEITDAAQAEKRGFSKEETAELQKLERELIRLEAGAEIQKEREEEIARKVGNRMSGGDYRSIFTPRAAPSAGAKFPNPLGMLARSAYDPKYAETRGITSSSGSASIQNPDVTNEVIYQLATQSNIGATGVPVIGPGNYTTWPVIPTGPASQWFQEGDTFSADTAMTISSKKITYSYVGILLKMSLIWLRDSAVDGEAMANQAILRAIDEAIMTALLSGSAASKQPVGFDNISGIQTVDAGSAPLTDFTKRVSAVQKLLTVDVALGDIAHVYGSASWGMTQNMVDTTSQPLMPPEGLKGITSVHSNAVRADYGAGTDETREYFFSKSNCRVAIGDKWEVNLVETYASTMEAGLLVVVPVDLQVFHPTTVCVIENISTSALIL